MSVVCFNSNIPLNPSERVIWMLKERDPGSVECVMCTSRTGIVVNVIHCSSCKQVTLELRRPDSFFHLIVFTDLVSKFCGDVQHEII